MKKLLTLLLLTTCFLAQAQINVGSNANAAFNKPGKLTDEDISILKNTTTLITLQFGDYKNLQQYEKAISSVWKITKYKIIRPDEVGAYMNKEGYSFFSFGGFVRSSSSGSNTHLYYDLWIPEINKKGKMSGTNYYSRIIMFPEAKLYEKKSDAQGSGFSEKMLNAMYNDVVFYNWGPGFLKGYLKHINDMLATGDTRGLYSDDQNEKALSKLKRDTLYVPDYVKIKYNKFMGTENTPDDDEKDDPSDAYPYPVRYLSAAELNNIIVESTKPVNYVVYIKSSAEKFVGVYNTEKGLIYSRFKNISYNFKNKDLAKIAKLVD